MKVHLAIGQYEFIEAEAETLAQAKEMQDQARAYWPVAPQQAPSTQGNVQQGSLGACRDCGSEMTAGKNGKKPYCKPCYIKWKDAQG